MRAIVYKMTDTNGTDHKIVIDLTRQQDIGENQARSNIIHDSIVNGYELASYHITRIEIP